MKLLIATHNPHKLREIREILSFPGLELLDMNDFPDLPEVEEEGDTFRANAREKAATLARATGLWALADDSGLAVDALGGDPGVRSARYAGEPVDYGANNSKLLAELGNTANRRARFHCAVALSMPGGRAAEVEATCEGWIGTRLRGRGGFGYDPLFIPAGYDQTFAEMGSEVKNSISHRANALKLARDAWAEVFHGRGSLTRRTRA